VTIPSVNFKSLPSRPLKQKNIRSNFDGRKNKILRANKLTHTSKKIDTHEDFFGQPVTVFMTLAMYKPVTVFKTFVMYWGGGAFLGARL
jgi:hypothetical protein